MFFVQNSGSKAAGTGLNKSGIIQKISLAQVANLTSLPSTLGSVTIETVPSNPQVINPNGGTNYKGNILYVGQGQGESAPQVYVMNPVAPYNTTGELNLFFFFLFLPSTRRPRMKLESKCTVSTQS
jgi:gluconolactonase